MKSYSRAQVPAADEMVAAALTRHLSARHCARQNYAARLYRKAKAGAQFSILIPLPFKQLDAGHHFIVLRLEWLPVP